MQDKQLSAGDPIESRCTKCRMTTNHTIIAVTVKGPAKVKCNTCGGEHKFRAPVVAGKKPAAQKTVAPPRVDRDEWAKLEPDLLNAKAVDYSMEAEYRVNAVIRHPRFGLGLVQRLAGHRKIEVLFEDGRKIMRCK